MMIPCREEVVCITLLTEWIRGDFSTSAIKGLYLRYSEEWR